MTQTSHLDKHPIHKRRTVEKSLRELVSTLTPGDRLPPLPDLRRHFNVASGTIQAAVDVLTQEGLVVRRHGVGTFVAEAGSAKVAAFSPSQTTAAAETIAVFARLNSAYFRDCIDHLIAQAAEQELGIECRYADQGLTLEDVLRYESRGVAGYLVVGPELEWIATAMIERGHRAAVLGEPVIDAELKAPAAFSDAEQGGYLATRHLLEQGHRRIAYLHIHSPEWLFQRRRWLGHLRALREAGLDTRSPQLISVLEVEGWYRDPEAARRFFAASNAPTAIAVWTDSTAVQMLGALQRAGIRVPEEVSLIGYDNGPSCEHCWPPIDSVDQHLDVLIRHALFLLSLPAPQQAISAAHITPTLICRGSCSPRPLDD